jgi:hypothetical protein
LRVIDGVAGPFMGPERCAAELDRYELLGAKPDLA